MQPSEPVGDFAAGGLLVRAPVAAARSVDDNDPRGLDHGGDLRPAWDEITPG